MFTQPWSTAIRRTEKSESSDSEYVSEEEQKPKDELEDPEDKESTRVDKEAPATKKIKKAQTYKPVHLGLDSDSESELVIALGEDPSGQEGRKNKKEPKVPSPKQEAIGRVELINCPAVGCHSEPIHFHHQAGDQHSAGGSVQQFWLCKHPGICYQRPSAIATASANVVADIAEYTSKMMDAIKGTMTEIYNDLSKNTTGSAIPEIRRLRIEIELLQWLHQQALAEMKHNLELTMAEMRQSLEQERD
ncbi:hypothetical protein STEG23_035263 [Scotinomys teguina]